MKFTFIHKRHKAQKIAAAPGWTDPVGQIGGVARKRFYCDRAGILEAVLYAPIKFHLAGGGDTLPEPALVRVRLVREATKTKPVDPTGYDERVLIADSDGYARIRFFYQGVAEKGRRYFWQIQVLGDVEAELVGTHYMEFWRR